VVKYQTIGDHISEDRDLNIHHCDNLKSSQNIRLSTLRNDQVKESAMGRACSTHREEECIWDFDGKARR
jgi:hypothetical protein